MQDKDRFKLWHGPYKSPSVQIGQQLYDEIRGPVIVGSWSNGQIPWPCLKTAGRPAFILCGDLLEAVRQESSIAIQHWWGVSPSTVHRWRRTLGIEQHTEGTRLLHRAWKPEKISEAAAKRGRSRGATPQGRAKMTATIRERGYYHTNQRVWTPEEEALLGTMSDPAVAQKIGRTLKAVGMWRRRKGVPAFHHGKPLNTGKQHIPLDAQKLTSRRMELNLSQRAVAKRAGMDATHLSQLESGFWRHMKPDTMHRLAKALRCDVRDLTAATVNHEAAFTEASTTEAPFEAPL